MLNGFKEYISDLGMGWGIILGIAILVILTGIYVKIRKNSRT
jgi:hypothetical protein